MTIQASVDRETSELIVFVDRDGLDALVDMLVGADSTAVPLTPRAPAAMTYPVNVLDLRRDEEDLVAIETEDGSASIVGSAAAFGLLAGELLLFVQYNDLYEPGMHIHFDPDEKAASAVVIRPGSRSLIVAGPVSDEPEASELKQPSS